MLRSACIVSIVFTSLFATTGNAPVCAAEAGVEVFHFGVYTSDKPSTMFGKFKPILSHLSEEVSKNLERPVKFKLRIINSYEGAIKALVDGKVHFVRFGPASYILAKNMNKDVQLMAKELNKGKDRFKGLFVVRKDSEIKSLKDLRGKKFAFGDQNSTIGRFLCQAALLDEGLRWEDLGKAEYLGRHDRVATAVLQGDFDAGAVKSGTFKKYKDKGLEELGFFWNVTKPWVACPGLNEDVVKALRKALLETDDKAVLSKVGKSLSGFGEAEDKDYEDIRVAMKRATQLTSNVPTESGN